MKSLFLSFACIFALSTMLRSQIIITPDTSTVQLVNNFIQYGVTASNITYTGAANSLGTFSNGITTNLGLTDGIVMTTGNLSYIGKYIGSPATEFANYNNNTLGDTIIFDFVNQTTNDAVILSFDLIPSGNILEFSYVFASEEYPEYAMSSYNDVFVFFISGPDPNGGNYTNQNIALVPNSTLPVAINSINQYHNTSYFIDNLGINGQTIVFDGFTTPLLAQISVVPSETYHLILAITDVADGLYDSAIFLKAQSMKSYTITGNTNPEKYLSNVFPNPASDKLQIQLPSFTENAIIEIFNMQGQLLVLESFSGATHQLFTGGLKKGIYTLKITTPQNTETLRLIIN